MTRSFHPRGAPGLWRFAGAEFHEADSRVVVGGQAQALDRSCHEILRYLLDHAGEVVTKEELLEAGWPGRVVSENSLAKAISRLRAALGPSGEAIRVAHGYGYRFNAAASFTASTPSVADLPGEGDALPARPGWRLTRRLGQGSTGVTFLAESGDGQQRTVKFARDATGLHGLKREIALSRYIRNADPGQRGVAAVLGWNLDRPPCFIELPYFAGGHLQDWALAHGGVDALPPERRVALAAAICDAVAAIHDLGVIHKDLKPENLYPIDEDGAVRVVVSDLGAGEAALSPQLAEHGLSFSLATGSSGASSLAGSLLYLAPEVVAGEAPTVRSDVYALGVLLYQLSAADLRAALAPGWEARVGDALLCEDIASACAADPANRLDARGLAQRLRTLDARRAEHREARARAEQAQRLAQRQARERQRRRLGLALSASLGIGLIASGWMYARSERQRHEAQVAAAQRQAVLQFVVDDVLGQADPYANTGGTGLSVREAVDRAASRVDRQLAHDPLAAAAVHAMIGNVYFGQDDHAAAVGHFEAARTRFLQAPSPPLDALVRVETALCDVHRIGGRFDEAERACAAAMAHARKGGVGLDVATLKLGQLRGEQGRYPDAQRILTPLLTSREVLGERRLRGELHWALGLCARALGQYDAARGHFEHLLAVAREMGEHSSWLGWAYNSLGSVLVETGDYDRAEATLVRAREVFERTQGAEQIETQMPQLWRADIRLQQGRWDEAAAMLRGVQAAWADKLKPDHPLRRRVDASLAWADAMTPRRELARQALQRALADMLDNASDRTAPSRTLRWVHVALALDETVAAGQLLDVFDRQLRDLLPDPHPLRSDADHLRAQWASRTGAAGRAIAPRRRRGAHGQAGRRMPILA